MGWIDLFLFCIPVLNLYDQVTDECKQLKGEWTFNLAPVPPIVEVHKRPEVPRKDGSSSVLRDDPSSQSWGEGPMTINTFARDLFFDRYTPGNT